jgi:hypothetical protein
MGDGMKRAFAAAKATRLTPVSVGDRMVDNDPRENHSGRGRVLEIVAVYWLKVHAKDVLLWNRTNGRLYTRARIYPIGTVRRSGFTLLPRTTP